MQFEHNKIQKIGFGGSCHWCTEAIFQSLLGVEKVGQGWIASTDASSSFSEAVIVEYDVSEISLETLIEIHLHTHSCTSEHSMRQKYRSAIYYYKPNDKQIAEEQITFLQKDFDSPIITKVLPFVDFKINTENFLDYYYSNPEKPFCENIINPKLKIILDKFKKNINLNKLNHLNNSEIGLGTAAIGRPVYINIKYQHLDTDFNLDKFKAQGITLINNAFQLGVKSFDSSPGYGIAEDLLIEFSKAIDSEEVFISTKWGYTYVANFNENPIQHELKNHSLETLNKQWEKSKLLLPHLKLYQIHSVTQESTVLGDQAVLNRLYEIKKEHKISIGLSTSGAFQNEVLKKALHITVNGEILFDAFQITFNLLDQSLLEIKEDLKGKKIIIKEALANGRILSENYRQYSLLQNELEHLANKYKVGKDAVAIRFCMDNFKGSTVLSGASNETHLNQNLKANTFQLDKMELEKLKAFSVNPKDYWEERKHLKWN